MLGPLPTSAEEPIAKALPDVLARIEATLAAPGPLLDITGAEALVATLKTEAGAQVHHLGEATSIRMLGIFALTSGSANALLHNWAATARRAMASASTSPPCPPDIEVPSA